MTKTNVAIGWFVGLMLLTHAVALPRAASAQVSTCGGFVSLTYVAGPNPAVPGDTIRVQLALGTGTITGGALNQLIIDRVRFDLDCNDTFPLALPCTDDGAVKSFEGNTANSGCFDAGGTAVTFIPNSSAGNFVPNEVVFTPVDSGTNPDPVVLAANTATDNGCIIQFDVKVLSYSNDSTPNSIEEVAGYRIVAGVPDAHCDNSLGTAAQQTAACQLAAFTPTPTNTPTPTSTQVPPTSTPTSTPGVTPTCVLIPGYCKTRVNDCLAEVCSFAAPPRNDNPLHPSNVLTCTDGDPTCDFGPPSDGICTFKLSLCFNVSDVHFACISPHRVTRVHLTNPGETNPRTATDAANRDAVEAALLTLPGASLTTTPARSILFTPAIAGSDVCSPPVLFNVPLRQTRMGLKSRRAFLQYRAYPDANRIGRDGDIFQFRCRPATQ